MGSGCRLGLGSRRAQPTSRPSGPNPYPYPNPNPNPNPNPSPVGRLADIDAAEQCLAARGELGAEARHAVEVRARLLRAGVLLGHHVQVVLAREGHGHPEVRVRVEARLGTRRADAVVVVVVVVVAAAAAAAAAAVLVVLVVLVLVLVVAAARRPSWPRAPERTRRGARP